MNKLLVILSILIFLCIALSAVFLSSVSKRADSASRVDQQEEGARFERPPFEVIP